MSTPVLEYAVADEQAESPSAYAWVVVALLWFVALLNYLDRVMISSMREPIVADVKMTDGQFGLLMSVFLWVYAAASPLGGFCADRLSRRWVIAASLLFWSAATALSGYAHSFGGLLTARALMGLSEACYIPAALALIADYHRGRTRSLATGLHMAGVYTGAALGGGAGYVAEHLGWRFGFKAFGAVGIIYCVVIAVALRDARVTRGGARDEVRAEEAMGALASQAGFWLLFVINVMVGVANWTTTAWLPTYLRDHFKLGLGKAGLSSTAYIMAASFVGVLAAGALADAWSRQNRRARAWVPSVGYLMAGPFVFLMASTDLFGVAVLGLIVFGLGRGAFDANHMPMLRELVPARYSATGYGVLNFISTAAGGVMVYVGGLTKDAHLDLSNVFRACGAGLAVVGVLLAVMKFKAREPSGSAAGRIEVLENA